MGNKDTKQLTCQHPLFKGDYCIRCGSSKSNCNNPITIPFKYLLPNMSLTIQEVNRQKEAYLQSLITRKKLHLVLDLDHTLLHARRLERLSLEDKQRADAPNSGLFKIFGGLFVGKLRPGARSFLEQASAMFDLSIYTMSARDYAKEMVRVLNAEGSTLFGKGQRVISREDCTTDRQKGLDVVLCHEKAVLIVDDKEEVWRDGDKSNVIRIARYKFFSKTRNPNPNPSPNPNPNPNGGGGEAIDLERKRCWCDKLNREDESQENGELARVLRVLKAVHSNFYDDNEDEYASRDVRQVLKRVQISSIWTEPSCGSGHKEDEDECRQKYKRCCEKDQNLNYTNSDVPTML